MAAKILLTGRSSFLGKSLLQKLKDKFVVETWDEDIRDLKMEERVDYVFHFAAPSSQILFVRKPGHCIDVTLNGFKKVLDYCRWSGAKLIYPSTGILNTSANNEYAMCKHLTEKMAQKSGVESLGLRIFAAYGPGEEHKREYKSVIGLFLDDILHDRRPVIYGDGEQKRDFIYIDDVVDSIIYLMDKEIGIKDIGSRLPRSFNDVIHIINEVTHKNIVPVYVDKPINYVEETCARELVVYNHTLENGIKAYYESNSFNNHQ